MKIFDYRYRAKRLKDGKILKGTTEAPSKTMVNRFLKEQGLKAIEINEHKSIWQQVNRITLGKVIGDRDLIFYLRQLGSLLKAGVKLNEASEMLATQQTNPNVRRILYGIYYEVNGGSTLAQAYREYPSDFPEVLIAMVEVGERTGDLKQAVTDIVEYFENQYRLRSAIQSTLMMPVIYLSVGIIVAIVLMTVVMPQFQSMFDTIDGVEMPMITQIFIATGDFFRDYILYILLGIITMISGFIIMKKRVTKFQRFLSAFAIRMPIIGQVVKLNNLSRIASTLAQMLNNHVPLQDSLETTYDTINNKIYKDLIIQAQKNVNTGDYISAAFEGHYASEVIFTRMIGVGEKTGDLPEMLKNLSDFYNDDSDVKVERLRKALEPVLLIFIFGLVLVMLLAVMLPSLSFTSQL